ncbi:hypothetical protein T01_3075 [Trichinella spiralis]|uniref:Uncharacterized protein n=1 Tax=Trichinella spiralis TaxID=6334 RepID=A0A0V1BTU5_TRISP|nr:hypothetical protein T01_3075 [Trichinella spiralis]
MVHGAVFKHTCVMWTAEHPSKKITKGARDYVTVLPQKHRLHHKQSCAAHSRAKNKRIAECCGFGAQINGIVTKAKSSFEIIYNMTTIIKSFMSFET